MIPLHKAFTSSVGKKIVMGLSGLALVGFVITHLLGNLTLLRSEGTSFNLYALSLASWGPLFVVAEVGLFALILVHVVMGIVVTKNNRTARPVGYRSLKSKGGHTLSNRSSRNMILTGLFLLAFLVVHVWQFRFGPNVEAGYSVEHNGVMMRDLFRLVHEVFHNPLNVGFYVVAMLLLGMHLRHGFWSAFQSLGAMNSRLTKPVYALGVLLALLLAVGFLFIPVWIYFDLSGAI